MWPSGQIVPCDTFPVPTGQTRPSGQGSQEEKSGVPRQGDQVPEPHGSQEIVLDVPPPIAGSRKVPGGQMNGMVVPKSGHDAPGGQG
mmetsp:Transcript_17799/g.31515  ORF Transcript_17799/g.31515 Transcript_17799/m.31515 type:complete len:87 (-) Transcript_17799:582-842(-)